VPTEAIHKLEPHRTLYLRGFDRRGCAASLNNASASGFTVSGVFSDQADFAVLVLFDADDQFGHLFTTKYLPDFSLTGVTLDFDLAITNAQNPISRKFQSVPWGAVSYITKSETPGTISLHRWRPPLPAWRRLRQTFTMNGTPALYDRVDLVYLSNIVYDYLVSTALSPGPSTVTFGFFNYLGTGYNHTITIGSNTYSHVQLSTDGPGDIAIALANAINAANDPNATASVSANNVILTARTEQRREHQLLGVRWQRPRHPDRVSGSLPVHRRTTGVADQRDELGQHQSHDRADGDCERRELHRLRRAVRDGQHLGHVGIVRLRPELPGIAGRRSYPYQRCPVRDRLVGVAHIGHPDGPLLARKRASTISRQAAAVTAMPSSCWRCTRPRPRT
jgi:hypothetical protein